MRWRYDLQSITFLSATHSGRYKSHCPHHPGTRHRTLPTQNTEEATPEPLPTEVISPDEETAASPEPAPGKPQIEDAPFTRFDREIEENPEFADLYLVRGQEYIDKRAYEAALADFEYALSLDENRGEPYAGMGKYTFICAGGAKRNQPSYPL